MRESANSLPPAGSAIHAHGLRSIAHSHSANVTFDTSIASTLEAASRDSVGTAVNYVSSLSALEAHLEGRIPDPAVLTELLRTTPNAVRVRWSSTRSGGTGDTTTATASQPMTTVTFAVRVVVGYAHVELKRPTPLELVITHTGAGGDDAAEALERAVRARFEAGAVAAASFACHTIERLGTLVLAMAFDATGAAWVSVEVRKPTIAELCDVTLEYASFRVWGCRDDPVLARGLDSAAWAARVDGVVPADLGPGNWQESEAQLRGPPPPKLPAERWASNFALLQRRNADERAFAAARCAAEINALGRGAGGPLRILDVGTGDGAVLREILRGVDGPDGSRPIVTALEPNAGLARAAAALLPDAAVLGGEPFTPTWAPPPHPHPPAVAWSDGKRPYDVALFVQSLYGHGDGTGPLLRRALELADRVVVVHRAGGVLTDVLNSRARLSGVVVEAAHTDLMLRTVALDGDGELHACLSAMTGRDVSDEASAAWARRKLAAPAQGSNTLPLPTSVFVLRRAGDDAGSAPPAASANANDQAPAAVVRDGCTSSVAPADPAMARLLRAGLGAVPHRVLRGGDELRAALKSRKHKVHALPPSAAGFMGGGFGMRFRTNLQPNVAQNHRIGHGFWRCVVNASPAPKYVTRIARHRGGVLQRVASLFTGSVLL